MDKQRSELRQLATVLMLSVLSGIAADSYVVLLSRGHWVGAIALSFVMPYLAFYYNHWWVSASTKHRLWLVTGSAIGGVLGLLVTINVFGSIQ